MKTKITITVLILISIIIGCSNSTKASGSVDNQIPVNNSDITLVYKDKSCHVHLIKIRGHEYLVSYTYSNRGGTCIIHAAHCPCHQTK